MAEGGQDPWESAVYRRNYECLLSLDAVLFRSKAFEAGLITGAVKDDLRYLGGGKIHNEELLKMGKGPGGPDSFLLLVKAVRLFGDKYDKQRKDLESVLPVVASSGGGEPPREPAGGAEFNRKKSLYDLTDTDAFGNAIGAFLAEGDREPLFKACVRAKGGVVDNASTIVFDFIAHHNRGATNHRNISGLLFYYIDGPTEHYVGDLFDLIIGVNKKYRDRVIAVINDPEFW